MITAHLVSKRTAPSSPAALQRPVGFYGEIWNIGAILGLYRGEWARKCKLQDFQAGTKYCRLFRES